MGYTFNNEAASANNNGGSSNEKWKAAAFLNLWLRRPDGSRVKIGAIALHNDKEVGKALIGRLQEDGAVEAMMKNLEADFQMAQRSAPVDLGF